MASHFPGQPTWRGQVVRVVHTGHRVGKCTLDGGHTKNGSDGTFNSTSIGNFAKYVVAIIECLVQRTNYLVNEPGVSTTFSSFNVLHDCISRMNLKIATPSFCKIGYQLLNV
jgi:hypothetical protein